MEGSDDQASWKTIVDEAWVFAVPAREPARYETLDLPENDFPFLRVTVHPGPDERERIAIVDASVPAEGRPPLREDVLVPRFSRVEDVKDAETWLVLELGARHQPFHAIDLEVSDARFFREVLVEARRERTGAGGAPALDWVEIGRGAVYRLEHEGRRRECLRVPVCGRERVLRVRLRNRDDRPLAIRGVVVRVPIERVVFEAASGRSHALRYGSRDLAAPAFDLARTVGDVGAWAAAAREGWLGSEQVARPIEASARAVDGAASGAALGRPDRRRGGPRGPDVPGDPPSLAADSRRGTPVRGVGVPPARGSDLGSSAEGKKAGLAPASMFWRGFAPQAPPLGEGTPAPRPPGAACYDPVVGLSRQPLARWSRRSSWLRPSRPSSPRRPRSRSRCPRARSCRSS